MAHDVVFLRDFYRDSRTFRALCDMIAKHEQPPVDRKLLCAEQAYRDCTEDARLVSVAVRAIELWESGYGA